MLLLTGLGLLGLALVLDLVLGVRHRWPRALPYLLGAVASVLLVIAGAFGLAGTAESLNLDTVLGFGAAHLVVDQLTALFLTITFAVATPASLACAGWAARPHRVRSRGLGASFALTLGSVAIVMCSDNIFCLLFGWELLTAAFYLLTAYARRSHATPAVITATFSKLSGAALLLGLLLLAASTRSFALSSFVTAPPGAARNTAFALLVFGFGIKIGILPVHVWIPRGYQAAPGPLRAVMAGIAVNVGFYGLWRTLALLHQPPAWLGPALLLIAGATALLGIAHTAVQTDLTQVVAYSSIENAGLIAAGFATALIGATLDRPALTGAGLVAATLQTIAHALAKTLLFTATAGIEDATGTTELDGLRGIGHRLPVSGTGLAIGALTLAGLPLTAGFVSEWFLLETLMQQFRLGQLGYTLPMALAGALVALTAGFASVAFVRIIGLTVLGPRSSREATPEGDVSPFGTAAIAMLALGCFGTAAVAPLETTLIGTGLAPVVPETATAGALKSSWVLQPVYPEFASISPSWLAIVVPLLFLGSGLLCFAFTRRRMFAIRRVPAWRSASGGVEGENQYPPFAFANPTRKVLANVLLTRAELRTIERQTGGRDDDPRRDPAAAHLGYTNDVVEIVERFLYRPLLRPAQSIVRVTKRLQSGRLDAYVAYMLITLVAALALIVTLS